MSKSWRNKWLWLVFLGLLVIGLIGVLGRCWQLQYYSSDYYREKAARQQLKIILRSARRGSIVDRKGRLLAVSTKVPAVWIDPFLIKDKKSAAAKLAGILNIDAKELRDRMVGRADKRFMRVKRAVSEEQAKKVRALEIRGVVVEQEYQRQYPLGQSAAHVVGFTKVDGEGLAGVELQFNEQLAGKVGKMELGVDVERRAVGTQGEITAVQDGQMVVLSLDAVIQEFVESALEKVVAKFHAESATGIVMDPRAGEVLALANWPAFDPAHARKSELKDVRRNRALTDPYEPGSTFKSFTVASAIEGGFVTINQKIDCLNRPYKGRGFGTINEYRPGKFYGTLSVADILVRSSNIGSAKLAQKMGCRYFHRMVEKFGFGTMTGIDLPGEGAGILSKEWTDKEYTLTRVGFGQGIAVTPIQLIRGFCCLANGGILVKPRMVLGTVQNGQVVEDYSRFKLPGAGIEIDGRLASAGRVISQKTAEDVVIKALVREVARKEGTGHNAYLDVSRRLGGVRQDRDSTDS